MSSFQSFEQAVEASLVSFLLPVITDYYKQNHGVDVKPEDLAAHLKLTRTAAPVVKAPPKPRATSSKPQSGDNEAQVCKIEEEFAQYAQGECVYLLRGKFCGAPVDDGKLFCPSHRAYRAKTIRTNMSTKIKDKLDENDGLIDRDLVKSASKKSTGASKTAKKLQPPSHASVLPHGKATQFGKRAKTQKPIGPKPSTITGKKSAMISAVTRKTDPLASFKYSKTHDAYVSEQYHLMAEKVDGELIVFAGYDVSEDDEMALSESNIKQAEALGLTIKMGDDELPDDDIMDDKDDLGYDQIEEGEEDY